MLYWEQALTTFWRAGAEALGNEIKATRTGFAAKAGQREEMRWLSRSGGSAGGSGR